MDDGSRRLGLEFGFSEIDPAHSHDAAAAAAEAPGFAHDGGSDESCRRAVGGVKVIRMKRARGEDAAEVITMRVKRTDTKEHEGLEVTRGIQLQRVEFDPGNPGVLMKAKSSTKYRNDRRGRVVSKFDYDPRPSNPHRREDSRNELKEGLRDKRLVKFLQARALGGRPDVADKSSGTFALTDPSSTVDPDAEHSACAEEAAQKVENIEVFDIVDLVAQDRAKVSESKYSDITCNDTQLERVLMRLQIDEKTGFTRRTDPKVPTLLQKGKGRPSWLEDGEDDSEAGMASDGAAMDAENGDIYDLYILPNHESLLDPGTEYWIEVDEDEFVPEEADALTDDSDDPDAKEIDYDDEYAESDDGEGPDGDLFYHTREIHDDELGGDDYDQFGY